ncbi:MAG: hypothetical protein L0Z53_06825 [Acidobacteriales bacterium]|nr:hypothetical protein [Terriglobales bacterium]
MANERGLSSPTAPAKTVVQPATPVTPFETPSSAPAIEKMSPEADAAHVTTLDDAAFRKALDLGSIAQPVEAPKPDNSDLERPAEESEQAEAAPEAPVQVAPTPEAPPTEPAEIPTLARAPETPFTVSDAEGELELPDVYFSFKANGKDYEKVPIDKLVRFAQMGIYNADKESKYRDVDLHISTLERRAQGAESRVQQLEKFYERLLADPQYYEDASALYQEQNTPEQRIARAEERTRAMQAQLDLEREELQRAARQEARQSELQSQYQRERDDQTVATFVRQELAPAFERLIQSNPLVNEREVLGQYTLMTAPLLERGRVPPSRLTEVKALIDHDLTNWVTALSADRQYAQAQADKKVQAVKAAATQAKRQVARAAAPTGSPAPMRAPAPKKYDDVDSWLKDGGGVLPPLQEAE